MLLTIALALGTVTYAVVRAPFGEFSDASSQTPAPPVEETTQTPSETPSPWTPPTTREPVPPVDPPVVDEGKGKWTAADGKSDVAGDTGQLLRYKVSVEDGIDVEPEKFADDVDSTLGDETRGWTAGGDLRLQRVPSDSDKKADFTVFLSSPVTTAEQCGGPNPAIFSCRTGDSVVINSERWIEMVDFWPEDEREEYREYLVNHEVGHRLGYGHVTCPKKGEPSPVMAQQSAELRGCEPNGWPYVDGEYVDGPEGEYV